ncbi:MAG: heavy metal-responsive transcriptional regulator [Terriglobia bacterium]
MSIGELAKAAGVSPDTLRHYERKGVLPRAVRLPNAYRQFPSVALDRVLLVRRALSLGFTIDELARILCVKERGGAPCRQVRDLAAKKLSEIEQRLQEIRTLRREFQTLLKDWDRRLAKTRSGRAYLLETLTGKEATPRAHLPRPAFQRMKHFKRRKRQNET